MRDNASTMKMAGSLIFILFLPWHLFSNFTLIKQKQQNLTKTTISDFLFFYVDLLDGNAEKKQCL